MILNPFSQEPLAPLAVLDDELSILKDISETAVPLLKLKNSWGFDAIECAQYLKKDPIIEIIHPLKPKQFLVRLKGENENKVVSQKEFEKFFGFTYWPFLYFADDKTFFKVIKNCPYLLRNDLFGEDNINLGKFYDEEIRDGYSARISVRWVNEEKGYGIFSEENLSIGDYIGEYTGEVRRLHRLSPDYNEYCFHYPTKFWSRNYYIIDSKKIGNLLRFANHSTRPNMKPFWIVKSGLLHMVFSAKTSIQKGTELTFDYGHEFRRKVSAGISDKTSK